jgi:hypothetical protein
LVSLTNMPFLMNGETTKEPLKVIAIDDPVMCAIYVRENGLLDQPRWKRFRHIAKNEKQSTRMVNEAKLKFLGLLNKLNASTRRMGTGNRTRSDRLIYHFI